MNGSVRLFPDSASTISGDVDTLFWALVAFSAALGLFLSGLVIAYAIRYRQSAPASRYGGRARTLPFEIAWTSASLVIAFVIFGWGAGLFMRDVNPPSDAMAIHGIGKQWMWKFRHPAASGRSTSCTCPWGGLSPSRSRRRM